MRLKDYFTIYAGGDLQKEYFSPIKTDINKYPIFSNSLENYGLFGFTSKPNYPKDSLTITGRGNVGHSFYRSEDFDAIIRLLVLEPKKNVNSKYFNYLINNSISFPLESTGVPQLTRPQVENTEVNLIHNDFQQDYIVNIMESVDNVIDSIQQNIKKVTNLLYGALAKHFNNNSLDSKPLEEIIQLKKGYQLNGDKLKSSGLYKMYNGGTSYSGMTDDYNTNENTIIISEGGNSCGYVNFIKEKFWAGGHCYTVSLIKKTNIKYLYFALKYNQERIMKLRVGSGLPNIQKKALYKFNLKMLFNVEEQDRYEEVFSSFENQINELKDKLYKYKNIRDGLSKGLFSGMINIPKNYEEV